MLNVVAVEDAIKEAKILIATVLTKNGSVQFRAKMRVNVTDVEVEDEVEAEYQVMVQDTVFGGREVDVFSGYGLVEAMNCFNEEVAELEAIK